VKYSRLFLSAVRLSWHNYKPTSGRLYEEADISLGDTPGHNADVPVTQPAMSPNVP
jgi:hypothetical protein